MCIQMSSVAYFYLHEWENRFIAEEDLAYIQRSSQRQRCLDEKVLVGVVRIKLGD